MHQVTIWNILIVSYTQKNQEKSLESDLYMREITHPIMVEADLKSPGGTLQDLSFANNLHVVAIIRNSERLIINIQSLFQS